MKKLSSSFSHMVLVLTIITLVAAALLAYINSLTAGTISGIEAANTEKGIFDVLAISDPAGVEVATTTADAITIHSVTRDGAPVGAAVESSASGFGGDVTVLVGFAGDTISGYKVMKHSETPGLGARADAWFRVAAGGEAKSVSAFSKIFLGNPDPAGDHNIIGKNPAKTNLTVSKDGGDIDAITASTITSRAFLKAVSNAYAAYCGQQVDTATGASAQCPADSVAVCTGEGEPATTVEP